MIKITRLIESGIKVVLLCGIELKRNKFEK